MTVIPLSVVTNDVFTCFVSLFYNTFKKFLHYLSLFPDIHFTLAIQRGDHYVQLNFSLCNSKFQLHNKSHNMGAMPR